MSIPIAITWEPDTPPSRGCPGPSYAAVHVTYGYPTSFQCVSDSGVVWATRIETTPSCPDGYRADFGAQICVPLSNDAGLDTVVAGGVFGLAFASTMFVYLIAFAAGAVIKAVKNG